MATNKFEELVQATIRKIDPLAVAPLIQLQVSPGAVQEQNAQPSPARELPLAAQAAISVRPLQEMGRAVQEIEQLRRATTVHTGITKENSAVVSRSSTSNREEGSSIGRTLLNTVGVTTGVGPLVSGLLSLFGSKKEEEPLPLQAFSLPSSIAVDAGLTSGGSFTDIQYSQNGLARSIGAPGPNNVQRPLASKDSANVQIHVQAMDSRSFLDHSDEIARAVKDAMLHSHSLNDVVTEL